MSFNPLSYYFIKLLYLRVFLRSGWNLTQWSCSMVLLHLARIDPYKKLMLFVYVLFMFFLCPVIIRQMRLC